MAVMMRVMVGGRQRFVIFEEQVLLKQRQRAE